ncbi:formylglycine-generating enzyme family protein [Blastopirellula sp. J2-11]|uniref:formylglycine-generating enzyme family protein n=1 Tax=Blastopirellula sp. J2-11 TaxID=2943192 RepID=UPI0021C78BB4|nr:formylglycine-generating enzyme family protein [Blastopirellula sp. J2-11]UUO05676.1 formylglycine-generating enzyme family protein [Blastopirellula sp. J2-11]
MLFIKQHWTTLAIGVAVGALGIAWLAGLWQIVVGVAALAAVAAFVFRIVRHRRLAVAASTSVARPQRPKSRPEPEPSDTEALARLMLEQARYALLLRPQIAANLPPHLLDQAREAFDDQMTIVPEGDVLVGRCKGNDDQEQAYGGNLIRVEAVYLDRFQVTNEEYQEFVNAGGYEQMPLWDPEIWPAVLDFVDQSGLPGPRYWRNSKHVEGEERLPVVGLCWYEAAAYARWVGKRLPSDPEWMKAGAWPVPLPGAEPIQRRFPWGESMDQGRANLWGCGPEHVVSVDQYGSGASVGGCHQLIGNVWEWTSSRFGAWRSPGDQLVMDSAMRSLRGGAYDTYFDHQASCDYQSGDKAVARKHNIGFRCAVSFCDILLEDDSFDSAGSEDELEAAGAAGMEN